MPYGVMSSGHLQRRRSVGADQPRGRRERRATTSRRSVPSTRSSGITLYDFRGTSDYNSMQVTLSRQTGKRLQYFLAYTYGKTKGTLGGELLDHGSVRSDPHLRRPQHGPHATS